MGAILPESAGVYFSWGNTDGHPAGAGYNFSQTVYDATPAAAIDADLTLDQDAARASLGSPWRMPSTAEFQELVDNCTSVWTTLNGMYGRLFTSNVNGNTLFLPAGGFYDGLYLANRGSTGAYWTNKYASANGAYRFGFNSSEISPVGTPARHYGMLIRAVQDGTPNRSIVPPIPEDEPKEEVTPTEEEPKDKDER